MRNRKLLPARLLQDYGRNRFELFYPSIYQGDKIVTQRDIIDLYQYCLEFKDTEAIELLMEAYDIPGIMENDMKYPVEKNIDGGLTKKESHNKYCRDKYQTSKGKGLQLGGTCYRPLFVRKKDETVAFSARKCVYGMTSEEMIKLLELSDSPPCGFERLSLVDKFEAFLKIPDRDKLILFYLRYMCDQNFPIDEYFALERGEIKIESNPRSY